MRILTLEYDLYKAVLAPQEGACLVSLHRNGREVFRNCNDSGDLPLGAACFPCVPYFGRLYDGLHFAGRQWKDLKATLSEASELPLHGHGWIAPWTIISHTASSALLRHDFTPKKQGDFPFAYGATQNISLDDNGLSIELTVENTGTSPMPVGSGLHPFFKRSPETCLQFKAAQFWFPPTNGNDGVLGPLPSRLGSSLNAPLPKHTLDHAFAGFNGNLVISNPGQTIQLSSNAPILHIYAPAGEDFFCAEPVSHLPGQLTDPETGFGGHILEPGETTSLAMVISHSE